jgi:hypothetical protein|tara:strand:+ start:1253 stop:1558 length:306 start_codon:yes stop_codon:yes gene_type:complete
MSHKHNKQDKNSYEFKMSIKKELISTFIGKDQLLNIKTKYKVDITILKPRENNNDWTIYVIGKKNRVKSAEIELIDRYNKICKIIINIIKSNNSKQEVEND